MRHTITQEDEMGCGAACVAFAARVSYEYAVKRLGEVKAKTIGFRIKELVESLNTHGLNYKSSHINRINKKLIYNDGVIVFIKKSKRYPYGHYLIRHNGLWADSWINLGPTSNLELAQSGYRKRLPGKVQWVIYPQQLTNK